MSAAPRTSKPVRPGLGGDLAGSRSAPGPTLSIPADASAPAPERPRWWRRRPAITPRRGEGVPRLGGRWTAGTSAAARLSVPLLVLAALTGPVALAVTVVAAYSTPTGTTPAQDTPDLIARRVAAEETALGLVQAWLAASSSDTTPLRKWWSGTELRLPAVGAKVSGARVMHATAVAPGVWSVLTAADVMPAGAASWQRRYFRVPVAVTGDQLTAAARALTIPAEVPAAGGDAAVAMAYSTNVPVTGPAGATVSGYLGALLTGTGDLTRWAAPTNPARPVTPPVYRTVTVQGIVAAGDVPGLITGTPADDAAVALLVTADLRTDPVPAASATPTGPAPVEPTPTAAPVVTTGQWLLTITARAGRWEVASIDLTPAL